MKKILIALLAALTFVGTATQQAHASEFLWKHFGAAPYASSREEAMRTRAEAFKCLDITDPAAITALVHATETAGTRVIVNNGDHFDGMLSKGCVAHANVTVAFAAPVQNMQYAAPAERWQVTVGEWTYILTRPDICNNWSVVKIHVALPPPPPAVAAGCGVTIYTHAAEVPQDATNVRFIYEYAGPNQLAPSTCQFKGKPFCVDKCNPFVDAEGVATAYAAERKWDLRIAYRDARETDLVSVGTHKWMVSVLPAEVMNNFGMFVVCIEYTLNGLTYKSVSSRTLILNPRDPNRKFEIKDFVFAPVSTEG